MQTFYWHDYETFGVNPRRDRPAQFAGLRTDAGLDPVGEPLVSYCQPADDFLPEPGACLITGITPQQAQAEGLPEWQFIEQINHELSRPDTCGVGYNSLRFDDEVTRFTLWRNFFDPYAREWQNGCSRWDLIDLVRATHALRPEGVHWPEREPGVPSFKLEDLATANQLEQARAHDALSDVHATIGLARLIRKRQPKLWRYALGLRDKQAVKGMLARSAGQPLVHVTSRVPGRQGCLTLWLPLMPHPVNSNETMGFDLRHDPAPLLELDAEDILEHLYTRSEELPEGVARVALKSIRANRSPFLAPLSVLNDAVLARCQLDVELCQRHAQTLTHNHDAICSKLQTLCELNRLDAEGDADTALYAGFVANEDRRLCERVRGMTSDDLAAETPLFGDDRLNELLLRYRGRHFPDSLDAAEREQWQRWRERKLRFAPDGGLTLEQYQSLITQQLQAGQGDAAVLAALREWGERLQAGLPAMI